MFMQLTQFFLQVRANYRKSPMLFFIRHLIGHHILSLKIKKTKFTKSLSFDNSTILKLVQHPPLSVPPLTKSLALSGLSFFRFVFKKAFKTFI